LGDSSEAGEDLLEFIPWSFRHAEHFKVSMNQPMTGMYIDRDRSVLANGLCGTDLHLYHVAVSAVAWTTFRQGHSAWREPEPPSSATEVSPTRRLRVIGIVK